MKNIEKIAKEILAKTVNIKSDQFSSNEELAKFLEKQPTDVRFNLPIYDLETGEIYLDLGQNFGKYEQYAIPKKLRGQQVQEKKKLKQFQEDLRKDNVFTLTDFKKYYRIINKGNGVLTISRTDVHPFEEYDVENIDDILFLNLKYHPEDLDVEQFKYKNPDNLKKGLKYYVVKPIGLNKEYVLNRFEDYYEIETKPLKYWFEEDTSIYTEYDGDAELPVKIIKIDKTVFSKDDLDIIKRYLDHANLSDLYGGANVELSARPGTKTLTENNLMMMMVR